MRHKRLVALGLVGLLVGAYAMSQVLALGTRFGRSGPRISIILCVSDGMCAFPLSRWVMPQLNWSAVCRGPASETLSRSFLQYLHDATSGGGINATVWAALDSGFRGKEGLDGGYGTTPLDSMQIGMSRTRSSNSLITDSAAGARGAPQPGAAGTDCIL